MLVHWLGVFLGNSSIISKYNLTKITAKLGQICNIVFTFITGKEYYLILVNSLWPASHQTVGRPGKRISRKLFSQGLNYYYAVFNLFFGICFWVVTWKTIADYEDNYTKSLAMTGLVACLINIVNHTICSWDGLMQVERIHPHLG